MTWHIDLDNRTATSVNGITFKLTEVEPHAFDWICTNPENIPPDDIDDEILSNMWTKPIKRTKKNYLKGGE
jgi:hypothetical protein